MKTPLILGVIVLVLLAGATWWSSTLQTGNNTPVVSQDGLHWHPTLVMYVKGEKIEIPGNIGLGAVHQPMHTHEDLPIIHLEYSGRVVEDDLKLGNFFANWGRDMRSFGTNMHMKVNGIDNTEYENYMMRDGDSIELHYD